MSNLRKEAKGRECMIRIPGVCNKRNETVVLCHLNNKRLLGIGTGQKVPDIFGAWGCSDCHSAVDHRTQSNCSHPELVIMFFEGVFRTQNKLLEEEKIMV